MEVGWYAYVRGQQQGPYTWPELWQKAQSGEIGPADQIWNEHMSGWTPADRIPGLLPARPSSYPGGATHTTGAFQGTPVKRRRKSGKVAVIIVAILLLVGVGVAAFSLLGDNGDTPPPASQATDLPWGVPVPPEAVFSSYNEQMMTYVYSINETIAVDEYYAQYQSVLENKGFILIPVEPARRDYAEFYINLEEGHNVGHCKIIPGRIDLLVYTEF